MYKKTLLIIYLLFLITLLHAQTPVIFKDANNKYGLKDQATAAIILQPRYDYINKFEDGIARVRLGDLINYPAKYGFINTKGQEIIHVQYSSAGGFDEGLCPVQKDGKNGFIDKTGKTIIPLMYEFSGSGFHDGIAAVKLNGKMGYIDKNNKTVLPFVYEDARSIRDGLALVKLNGKYGFISKTGKQVIAANHDYAYEFSEGLAAVNKGGVMGDYFIKGGKWGFIDKTGKQVIPFLYDNVNPFSEGLACVMQNKKAGYIDNTGRLVIPMLYGTLSSFEYGKAPVTLNGQHFYIDKTGKQAPPSKKVIFTNGIYIGEVASDGTTPNGFGKMNWTNGNSYDGAWLNGKMHGKGKYTFKDGKINEGDFVNGNFQGNTSTPATTERKVYPTSIPSPEPHETNFKKAFYAATTSDARGAALATYLEAIDKMNFSEADKTSLTVAKFNEGMDVDFFGVFQAILKASKINTGFFTQSIFPKLLPEQAAAFKALSKYTVDKYVAKRDNKPEPIYPAIAPPPGAPWGKNTATPTPPVKPVVKTEPEKTTVKNDDCQNAHYNDITKQNGLYEKGTVLKNNSGALFVIDYPVCTTNGYYVVEKRTGGYFDRNGRGKMYRENVTIKFTEIANRYYTLSDVKYLCKVCQGYGAVTEKDGWGARVGNEYISGGRDRAAICNNCHGMGLVTKDKANILKLSN